MKPESKSLATSKTALVNAIIAVAVCFFPPAAAWIQSHPTESLVIVNLLNILLRIITKQKIHLFSEDQGGMKLPLILAFCGCLLQASCQPALVKINVPARSANPPAVRTIESPPPADGTVISPAVYRPASDADLVRALETLTPINH